VSSPRSHGGADAWGVPRHDFSTNGNAAGPCPPALAAVRAADVTRYPDGSYTAVRAGLAAFHGVAPERVLLAASASEFIFRFTAWVAQQGGRRVWLPPHHYGDYAAAAQAWNLHRTDQVRLAQLAWACDPSSPLGQTQPGLPKLAEQAPVLVLDRAYEPLRLEGMPAALSQEQWQRVWQLWTPNKALGLTGVRAAYAIAPLGAVAAVESLQRLCPSWPLGAEGAALLQAWPQEPVQRWLHESLATLRDWKARQIAVCEALGWRCAPSLTNYFCARPDVPEPALAAALPALRAQGIKLRDAASFGLSGWVRLAVLAPAAQDALAQAWPRIRSLVRQETPQGACP